MMVIDSTTLNDFDSFVEVSVKGSVLLHCFPSSSVEYVEM